MDHLPELPFEQILSYLSLLDVIKSRAVCRAWKMKVDNFRVKSLCYSTKHVNYVYGKKQLVSGAFAQNFIGSSAFKAFFNTFGSSILSNLKHLRLCNLKVPSEKLAKMLNSFVRLEELDILRLQTYVPIHLKVNLPMLNSIHLNSMIKIKKLTLDAPRLRKIKFLSCLWPLDLVHGESVERLATKNLKWIKVKRLKNLKYLFCSDAKIDFKFLHRLKQLKEISVCEKANAIKLFEQKELYGRADLKIYLAGLLCDSLDDIEQFRRKNSFVHLAENPFRLADEIPTGNTFDYKMVERVAPGAENAVLSRATDLSALDLSKPVQDIERFLDFLKRFDRFVHIHLWCDQQKLLELLPEHCEVHSLDIHRELSDSFLFRLKHLVCLRAYYSVDAAMMLKVFKELPFLQTFNFKYNQQNVQIYNGRPGEFGVAVDKQQKRLPDLNAAIEFITKTAQQTAEEMEE